MEKEIGYFRIAKEDENKMWIYAGAAMGALLINQLLPLDNILLGVIKVLLSAATGYGIWMLLKEQQKGYAENASDPKATLFQLAIISLLVTYGCAVLGGLIGLGSIKAGSAGGAIGAGLFGVIAGIAGIVYYIAMILISVDMKNRFGGQISQSGLIILIAEIVSVVFAIIGLAAMSVSMINLISWVSLICSIAIVYALRADLKSE